MGAEVIKVEPPFGDASRHHRGANNSLPKEAFGTQFVAMNKGKRSVVLDAHTDLGREVLQRLLATADVFITNYRSDALTRMGLDIDELVEKFPKLVVGKVNGFGPFGEDAHKAMLDGAAQARSGLLSMNGYADDVPMAPGVLLADHAGGMQLALACMTALMAREKTGRGQLVLTSSLGTMLWLQMWELQHSAMTGVPLSRCGPHHPNLKAPYGVYATSDGGAIVFVHARSDESWAEFWIFMDKPEVVMMEAWDTAGKRIGLAGSDDKLDEIRALMRESIGSKTLAEMEEFLSGQPEIVWERVRGYEDVFTDPQNLANDYLVELDLPIVGTVKTIGSLVHMSDTPPLEQRLPPGLSADTADVMGELGFTDDEASSVIDHAAAVRDELLANMFGSN
jgi:crotonobetainyl-CoA:carnitine CoA-transferase CaiB-like acyl-CoA transferase